MRRLWRSVWAEKSVPKHRENAENRRHTGTLNRINDLQGISRAFVQVCRHTARLTFGTLVTYSFQRVCQCAVTFWHAWHAARFASVPHFPLPLGREMARSGEIGKNRDLKTEEQTNGTTANTDGDSRIAR